MEIVLIKPLFNSTTVITQYHSTISLAITAWKVSKYGVISSPNTGKYRPEVTPYFGHFLRSEYIKKILK